MLAFADNSVTDKGPDIRDMVDAHQSGQKMTSPRRLQGMSDVHG
jgi:hypothetical protein